jgi:hypothetical protein
VTLLGAVAIAITVVAVLRSRPHGGPSVRCGAGAIAVMVALGVVATIVVLGRGGVALPLLGLPIVAGLTASADGGSRRSSGAAAARARAVPTRCWPAIRCWPPRPRSACSPPCGI